MLVEFSVTNFRSIKERATLSMVATKASEYRETNVVPGPKGRDVLASAALYGPNASGKSSILLAVQAMRETVVRSTQRGDDIPIRPYLFDEVSAKNPTEFEVVFIHDGVQYQYGFTATRKKIFSEWLFAFPKGRPQRWISREWDEREQIYQSSISDKVPGARSLWLESTKDNALVLSTAVQLNCGHFAPVYDWFRNLLRFIEAGETYPGYTADLCLDNGKKENILEFVRAADFDISDVLVSKEKFDPSRLPADMPETLKEEIKEEFKDKEILDIKMIHTTSNGGSARLDLHEESDGTQKLFGLVGPWLNVLEEGMTLFVDELHGSLHPLLVKFLVEIFHDPRINKRGAQLVFTTHDTAILSQKVFRRDQIWFIEKRPKSGTTLFPLTDFSPRKGVEDIRSHYLEGRYGALPLFSDVYNAFGVGSGN